ncbi:caspase family protein [Actinomadura fulvescens]|uniref:Peptidase C14 caspase domain-containing protein n=1 Tax=Actinomadura fulvescens TaxID=46160 RepID=A0ABN3QNU2_9ACTN
MNALPDRLRSRAVLIGTSTYRRLDPLPSVRNNVEALAAALRNEQICGLAPQNVVKVHDPDSTPELMDPILEAAAAATDTILIYYAGHGLIEERRGELHLALVQSDSTDSGRSAYTAVRYGLVRDALLNCRAVRRIVILDCCYSGRAVGQMSANGPASSVLDEALVEGSYILAAAGENRGALAPAEEDYSAFTGELLRVVYDGLPGQGEFLDLNTIYAHVRAALKEKGRPLPQVRELNRVGLTKFVRNQAHRGSRSALPRPPTSVHAGSPAEHAPRLRNRSRRDVLITMTAAASAGGLGFLAWPSKPESATQGRPPAITPPPSRVSTTPAPHASARVLRDTGIRLRLPSAIYALCFSPNGAILATTHNDAIVNLWNVSQRRLLTTIRGHEKEVRSMAFSPNGRLLATGSEDRSVRLWDVRTGAPLGILGRHGNTVPGLDFSPDGATLASVSSDCTLGLWDVARRAKIGRLGDYESNGWLWSVAFTPNGKTLAAGNISEAIFLWDVRTRRRIRILKGHTGGIITVSFNRDGSLMASASKDKTIRLWRMKDEMPLAVLTGHHDVVSEVQFNRDGRTLLSTSDDGTTKLWDLATRRLLRTIEGCDASAAFTAKGDLLATASRDRTVHFWRFT